MAEKLLRKLMGMGFAEVTVNLWHGSNLYVNIEGVKPFYYWLGGHCKVCSREKLDPEVFAKVRTLCVWLNQHRKDIIREMGDGAYYKSTTLTENN